MVQALLLRLTILTLLVLGSLARAEEPAPMRPRWPEPNAPLVAPQLEVPKGFGRKRIYLDAGHGAPGNKGALTVQCEDEQEHTLRVAQALARGLEATGLFEVQLSRQPGLSPTYPERLRSAQEWRAHAFISLHADSRGAIGQWEPRPGQVCPRLDEQPGFSVLWSDDAPSPLASQRKALALALARRLLQTGFTAYDGLDYATLYETDSDAPGVFVDSRQGRGRHLYLLRRPVLPSVILETHQAVHLAESERWKESRTLEAFTAALAAALVDVLR